MPPDKFRHGFYSQFVFVGLFVPMIWFMPESPWYHTRRHQDQKAKQAMSRLYATASNYDVETEFAVLRENVAASEALRAQQDSSSYTELFKGSNGQVCFISQPRPMLMGQATNFYILFPSGFSTSAGHPAHLWLLGIFLLSGWCRRSLPRHSGRPSRPARLYRPLILHR